MATEAAPPAYRRGVRFRLSLLLLLAGLNLAMLGGFLLLLLSPTSLRGDPVQQLELWHIGYATEALHVRLLVDGMVASRLGVRPAFPAARFTALKASAVEVLGEDAAELTRPLDAYEKAARAWYASDLHVPPSFRDASDGGDDAEALLQAAEQEDAKLEPAARPPEPAPAVTLAAVQAGHRALRLALARVFSERLLERPRAVRTLVYLLVAWSFLSALLFVLTAWRLRAYLSDPLDRLARAALAIGDGRLDTPLHLGRRTDELGALRRAVEKMRDKLHRQMGELRDQNERMRAIFDTMSDGVLLVDAEGRVRQFNRAAERLLGLGGSLPLIEQQRLDRLGIPELQQPTSAEGDIPALEFALPGPRERSGRKHRRVVRSRLRSSGGQPTGYVAVIQDTSHEKEMERLQNDFFSMVTHELKTPLTAIEGYTRLLLKERPGPLSEDQRRFLGTVLAQSNVLKRMVQDLLDVSRLAAGRIQLKVAPVAVHSWLAAVVERFEPKAGQQDIELHLSCAPPEQEALQVPLDRARMDQVLGNLLGNALRFTPAAGRVSVGWQSGPEQLTITVADTGVGVPPDDLARIFDKFYQVEQGDTRTSGGVGLGLYICRELVRAHGGVVVARNRSGPGTVFEITLPLRRQSGGARLPTPP